MKALLLFKSFGNAVMLCLCFGTVHADDVAKMRLDAPSITMTTTTDLNFVPLDAKDTTGKGPKIALLFGELKTQAPVAFLAWLPPGYRAGPHSHRSDSYLVGIKGRYHEFSPGQKEGKPMGIGGHLRCPANVVHDNHCDAKGGPCLNYAYYPNGFDVQHPKP